LSCHPDAATMGGASIYPLSRVLHHNQVQDAASKESSGPQHLTTPHHTRPHQPRRNNQLRSQAQAEAQAHALGPVLGRAFKQLLCCAVCAKLLRQNNRPTLLWPILISFPAPGISSEPARKERVAACCCTSLALLLSPDQPDSFRRTAAHG
jgi:hypothetical protein